jgi:hypothetical protein
VESGGEDELDELNRTLMTRILMIGADLKGSPSALSAEIRVICVICVPKSTYQ